MWKQNKIASESYTARLNTYKKKYKMGHFRQQE